MVDNLDTSNWTNKDEKEDVDKYWSILILFICIIIVFGALARTVLKTLWLPYTVVLMLVGFVIGICTRYVPGLTGYMLTNHLATQHLLSIFLPILIFDVAFKIEIKAFLKYFLPIILLAVPGFLFSAFMLCTFCKYVFVYDWSWYVGMMFGSLLSTTDSAAVITLLKDSEGSQHMSTILQGESLLSIAVAVLMFNLFKMLADPRITFGALDIFIYLIRVTVGGTAFGLIMGKLTALWLVNTVTDPLTEIGITLGSVYITFTLGNTWLLVSGAFPLVAMAITVSASRSSLTPEVETFLNGFWQVLRYLANSIVFVIAGVFITENGIQHTHIHDWFVVLALYCLLFITRAAVLGIMSPLLVRVGYGLTWHWSAVMTWCGLRGPVSLMLALVIFGDTIIDVTGITQNQIVLHCALINLLVLSINATSTASVLKSLGFREISMPKRYAMASAVRSLKTNVQTLLNSYKTDRFLADAEWKVVVTYVAITDPYKTTEEEAALDDLTNLNNTLICPGCETEIIADPTNKEMEEMMNEARLRVLKAEKMSYWKQHAEGMMSRDAAHRLVELVQAASNTSDIEKMRINLDELKKSWQINKFYKHLKQRFERWRYQKPSEEMIVWPKNKIRRIALKICMQSAFDIFLYTVVFLNVVCVILELIYTCPGEVYEIVFDVLNYIFTAIYLAEAAIKITAYKVDYFKDKWCLLDFFILIMSIAEIIMDITIFRGESDCSGSVKSYFSPSLLKIVKVIRLLRLLRSLRLVKALVPQVLGIIDGQINKKIRFGYDVGVGFVTGEEDVIKRIDMIVANAKIAELLKNECEANRKEIIRELDELQKSHPGITVSVKTEHAARRILIKVLENISKLKGVGVLDENEAGKLQHMVEMKLKKLLKIPYIIEPPPPEEIISNLAWIAEDVDLINYIKARAKLVTMHESEQTDVESDPRGGIYVVISGLIKIDRFVEDYSYRNGEEAGQAVPRYQHSQILDYVMLPPPPSKIEKTSDYISTGALLGELSLLTGKPCKAIITCDTSVQMYHISYEAIQAALELFTEKPSLEYRLWRVAAARVAVPLVKKINYFRDWDINRIIMHLEKCPLIMKKWQLLDSRFSLAPYIFDIESLGMIDLVLIYGFAQNPQTSAVYQGPCYIPNSMKTLYLLPCRTEKHILLIVTRDVTIQVDGEISEEGDYMKTLQKAIQNAPSLHTGIMRERSSLCLLHSARERKELNIKASEQKINAASNKHKITKKVSGLLSRNTGGIKSAREGGIGSEQLYTASSKQKRSPTIVATTSKEH